MADYGTLKERALERKREYAQAVAAIDANTQLSERGKAEQKAALHAKLEADLASMRQQYSQGRAERLRKLQHDALGMRMSYNGDRATTEASYRVALAQIDQMKNSDEALTALKRADRMQDNTMTHALAIAARERGWSNVLSAYLRIRPEEAQMWQDLDTHEMGMQAEASGAGRFEERMLFAAPARPASPPPADGGSSSGNNAQMNAALRDQWRGSQGDAEGE